MVGIRKNWLSRRNGHRLNIFHAAIALICTDRWYGGGPGRPKEADAVFGLAARAGRSYHRMVRLCQVVGSLAHLPAQHSVRSGGCLFPTGLFCSGARSSLTNGSPQRELIDQHERTSYWCGWTGGGRCYRGFWGNTVGICSGCGFFYYFRCLYSTHGAVVLFSHSTTIVIYRQQQAVDQNSLEGYIGRPEICGRFTIFMDYNLDCQSFQYHPERSYRSGPAIPGQRPSPRRGWPAWRIVFIVFSWFGYRSNLLWQ